MDEKLRKLLSQEWLITNGTGGFASGTVAGAATRRYHSLLTAALNPPTGRMAMLAGVDETIIFPSGESYSLATHVYEDGTVHPNGWEYITDFTFEKNSAKWEFTLSNNVKVTKILTISRNNVVMTWNIFPEYETYIQIAPLVYWKDMHNEMEEWEGFPFRSEGEGERWRFQATSDSPLVRFFGVSGKWQSTGWWNRNISHLIEKERGFNHIESFYCPAIINIESNKIFLFSVDTDTKIGPEPYPSGPEHPLLTSAKQFLVHGKDRQTIIAGYPWFADWGRDTFISLPGLCLATKKYDTAREILLSFTKWVKNGRIPNKFPDNDEEPMYNNADGTLWYLRACRLYIEATNDTDFATQIAPVKAEILAAHRSNTVGDDIYVTENGLLHAGNDHTNLTWMDAKVDGVPITPRYGFPVEINALWLDATDFEHLGAFLAVFVRQDGLGLYDYHRSATLAVPPRGGKGGENQIRPNMVIAAAILGDKLPLEVRKAVLATATEHLLTPYGLRTLAPTDAQYVGRYEGGPRERDAVYHQGTVWPWLIGPFLTLYKSVHGADADVSGFLAPLLEHFHNDYGLGGIAEIFDGDAPHRPNGCPWQAWSLAAVLEHFEQHDLEM
jgi:glycogen debranching enzyme